MDFPAPLLQLTRKKTKPRLLTSRMDEIIKAVHTYRYVTAKDITRLFFARASISHVREILASLAGNGDYIDRQYLYRFPFPNTRIGATEKIYTLGAKGRQYLKSLGIAADWYFRPADVSSLTYQHLKHALTLTRFLVAARVYCQEREEIELYTVRTQYELNREPSLVEISENTAKTQSTQTIKVVPDAWLDFEFLKHGQHQTWVPVLLEIDRGSEQQKYFKRHVTSRLEFIKPNGGYKRMFDTNAVTIAYATTGNARRLQTMLTWTEEVLSDLDRKKWASVFRFCSLSGELDPNVLFQDSSWYRPHETKPVPLL
jgi:hypothetical protein